MKRWPWIVAGLAGIGAAFAFLSPSKASTRRRAPAGPRGSMDAAIDADLRRMQLPDRLDAAERAVMFDGLKELQAWYAAASFGAAIGAEVDPPAPGELPKWEATIRLLFLNYSDAELLTGFARLGFTREQIDTIFSVVQERGLNP